MLGVVNKHELAVSHYVSQAGNAQVRLLTTAGRSSLLVQSTSSPSTSSRGFSSLRSDSLAMMASRLTEPVLPWEDTEDDRALGAQLPIEDVEDRADGRESNALLKL